MCFVERPSALCPFPMAPVHAARPDYASAKMQSPSPFGVLWIQNSPSGQAIPMRLGRDRRKPLLWGDGFGNFGFVHIQKGHIGPSADWPSERVMATQVRRAIETPSGIFPDMYTPSFMHYIKCDDYAVLSVHVRITVEVVVDSRVLPDGLPLGVKTGWQTVEFF